MDTFTHFPQTSTPNTKTASASPFPLIVGTNRGLRVFTPEPRVALEGQAITALAVAPDQSWWAIVDHTDIWHRDACCLWHKVEVVTDRRLHCLLPLEDAVLVGTSSACLIHLAHGNLKRINCFEAVAGHEDWYTPWGAPPDVRSLAASSTGDLYVNVHVGGILRSRDRGQSWQPTIDLQADVHEVCTVPGRPDWVLAATAQGLAISEDRGDTWRFDRTHLHGSYARAIAVCGETILMSASTGPRSDQAALYRRPLDGSGFEKCESGLPEWFPHNINTSTLATVAPFAAFGTHAGEVFLSSDCGEHWQPVTAGLTPICCLAIAQ